PAVAWNKSIGCCVRPASNVELLDALSGQATHSTVGRHGVVIRDRRGGLRPTYTSPAWVSEFRTDIPESHPPSVEDGKSDRARSAGFRGIGRPCIPFVRLLRRGGLRVTGPSV